MLDENQQREFEQLMQTAPYRKALEMQKSFLEVAREETELKTLRNVLIGQSEVRFGPLPERSRKKIDRLSADELKKLTLQLPLVERRSDLGL